MEAAKGPQHGLLQEVLGVVAIAREPQSRGIECVKMWQSGLLELQPLIAMRTALSHRILTVLPRLADGGPTTSGAALLKRGEPVASNLGYRA